MTNQEKEKRLVEINELIQGFCNQHLNNEFADYAMKLCYKLGRKRMPIITRGRKEIWAAAIVYVIARLNFLFDQNHKYFLIADTICEFFGTKKSTVGNKATQIEKICNLGLGAEGFCSPEITDMLTFIETPDGFILPKSFISKYDVAVEFVEGKEAEELENYITLQQSRKEREAAEKKARRAEINQKIAEEKKKKKLENQLSLFDD